MTKMETTTNSPLYSVTVKYPAGDSREYKFSLSSWFCPYCGKQSVFQDDCTYESQTQNVCITCGEDFYITGGLGADGHAQRQMVEQIKAALAG